MKEWSIDYVGLAVVRLLAQRTPVFMGLLSSAAPAAEVSWQGYRRQRAVAESMSFGAPPDDQGTIPAVGLYETPQSAAPLVVYLLTHPVRAEPGKPIVIDPDNLSGLPA